VNADEIARRIGVGGAGRAPDLLAGREMLRLLDELTAQRRDIALETTLATRSHAHRIARWRRAGYRIELVYLRLPDVEASLARVAGRVARGGHDIPEADIHRRFPRSLEYMETVYKPVVDAWWVRTDEALTGSTTQTAPIEDALREARWKALHGAPEERAGRYLGKQEAVERAAGWVRARLAGRGA
jgi:predicted ABC-type ATPase